jgi:hypothetical protein
MKSYSPQQKSKSSGRRCSSQVSTPKKFKLPSCGLAHLLTRSPKDSPLPKFWDFLLVDHFLDFGPFSDVLAELFIPHPWLDLSQLRFFGGSKVFFHNTTERVSKFVSPYR